jgi:hypothetical protein
MLQPHHRRTRLREAFFHRRIGGFAIAIRKRIGLINPMRFFANEDRVIV